MGNHSINASDKVRIPEIPGRSVIGRDYGSAWYDRHKPPPNFPASASSSDLNINFKDFGEHWGKAERSTAQVQLHERLDKVNSPDPEIRTLGTDTSEGTLEVKIGCAALGCLAFEIAQ